MWLVRSLRSNGVQIEVVQGGQTVHKRIGGKGATTTDVLTEDIKTQESMNLVSCTLIGEKKDAPQPAPQPAPDDTESVVDLEDEIDKDDEVTAEVQCYDLKDLKELDKVELIELLSKNEIVGVDTDVSVRKLRKAIAALQIPKE